VEEREREILEYEILPLLIEGLDLMDEEKYNEAYARINDAVVLIAADLIPETNIEDITERVLRNIKINRRRYRNEVVGGGN